MYIYIHNIYVRSPSHTDTDSDSDTDTDTDTHPPTHTPTHTEPGLPSTATRK